MLTCLRRAAPLSACAAILACIAVGPANAATLQLDFDLSFGDPLDTDSAPPSGGTPWATALFDDGDTAGSVTLTISLAASVGDADMTGLYFNLNPALDPLALNILRTGGTGPSDATTTLNQAPDAWQADGDGRYDIWFDYPPPPGNQAARFNGGEFITYDITGIATLTAGDFNFLAAPGGPNGPFLAAAKIQDTTCLPGTPGEGTTGCSDWIAATPIPVPAAAWLLGSAIGLLGWMRRRAD